MKTLDWKKELKHPYQPPAKEVVAVEVPPMNFLMINGKGDPNTAQEYADAVEALFAVAYAIKFAVKKGALAIDYGVMPLEGLWWADDMSQFSAEGPTIARVHDFIQASGNQLRGKHHEIYLSDIRKADPAKWKTIIRQPMR